jgi:hypothetical protein
LPGSAWIVMLLLMPPTARMTGTYLRSQQLVETGSHKHFAGAVFKS